MAEEGGAQVVLGDVHCLCGELQQGGCSSLVVSMENVSNCRLVNAIECLNRDPTTPI
jgi:hypothetical protein